MKIYTITCHEVYNYGASLQEYALLHYLEQQGHEARTIQYKPPYLSKHFDLWRVSNPRWNKPILKWAYLIMKLPSRLKMLRRKKAFDVFSDRYIKRTDRRFENNKSLLQGLDPVDAYICGSDQIWNSFFENGKDPAFYLDFAPTEAIKVSYAASFAIDSIEENLKPFVRDQVAKLDHIGVRETSGVAIIDDLGVAGAQQVLDPVFLIDAEQWRSTFSISQREEPYVLVYDFDSNPVIREMAQSYAKQHAAKIYTVNQNIDYADKNFYLEGPDKYLELMAHAQMVVTNSFHSVAFSLIFERQFVVVNRFEKINTRMRDLLGLFDLDRLLIDRSFDWKSWESIDYQVVRPKQQLAVERSKAFLDQALISKNA